MKIEAQPDRVIFSELSEDQWQAATDWLSGELVSHEVWEDDHSKVVLHQPSSEKREELATLLSATG